MSGAIVLDAVKKQFSGMDRPAVNGLSLHIAQGEVYGLLGPNGAGKSSTVMMICGLLQPDEGNIQVLGIDALKDSRKVRRAIGVATQEIALFPALTAYENLEYLMRMYGTAFNRNRILQLLEIFGLTTKMQQPVHTYSGGMKRRLNLIASILHEPQLLILDEPTAGVDVQSRTMILDFLKEENAKGMTMLYTSHHLEEAEKICSRVGVVDAGKLIAQGSLDDLRQQYGMNDLESVFLHLTGRTIRE
ncbi:MAG: ABC transporter ATP-binding protein [Chitinophagales bacterium]